MVCSRPYTKAAGVPHRMPRAAVKAPRTTELINSFLLFKVGGEGLSLPLQHYDLPGIEQRPKSVLSVVFKQPEGLLNLENTP